MNKPVLDIDWGDDVGQLFDKITLLTLKDVRLSLQMDVDRQRNLLDEDGLSPHGYMDFEDDVRTLASINNVIEYFGG